MPIYKTPKGYKIKNVPGYHEKREDALAQLRAIEAKKKK